MPINVVTYFDSAFYGRGLAMINSILKNTNAVDLKIIVLALDDEVEKKLLDLQMKQLVIISLHDLLGINFDTDTKKYANSKEFFFSLTPRICLYCLENLKLESILYVDADIYFFNDINMIFKEIGDASIAICPHRLPFFMRPFSTKYGIYNVGINFFRNNEMSILCLHAWNRFCLDWTPEQIGWKLSFFSDQVWLDDWPLKYQNLKIINHIGINTAPWNAINYSFTKKNKQYYVNKEPLIAYHFSNLGKIKENTWNANVGELIINIRGPLLDLYKDYLLQIDKYEISRLKVIQKKRNILKRAIFSFTKIFFNSIVILKKN